MCAQFMPWPPVEVPEYKPGKFGRWTLATTRGAMPGWYSPEVYSSENMPALKRREHGKDIVWMSLTMMERESHMPHIAAATGSIVVMGLGMGMYLYNIIKKPAVTSVVVIERDPQVVTMLERFANPTSWPGWEKVEIVIADALEWKSAERFDFLYADFWKHMGDNKMTAYMSSVRKHVPNVALYGYWTQEFDYIDYLRKRDIRMLNTTAALYKEWCESMGMPLVG